MVSKLDAARLAFEAKDQVDGIMELVEEEIKDVEAELSDESGAGEILKNGEIERETNTRATIRYDGELYRVTIEKVENDKIELEVV